MTAMSPHSDVRHVAITGASRGIGAALAKVLAETPDCRLSLAARNIDLLNNVQQVCEELGAEVSATILDVRDAGAVTQWLSECDHRQPLDLVIVNAGVFDGHGSCGALETAAETKLLVDVNVTGAIVTAQAAISIMRPRKRGHIAIISSLAALLPLADAPTYSASKAALLNYGEALRLLLVEDCIEVSIILPGHVRTEQTRRHIGPLKMIIDADDAARCIQTGLARRQHIIAFPRRAYWLVSIARWLPWSLRRRASGGDRFHVQKQ